MTRDAIVEAAGAPSPLPAVVIRFGLESRPELLIDAIGQGDRQRLRDWMSAHPEYLSLVGQWLEIRVDELLRGVG